MYIVSISIVEFSESLISAIKPGMDGFKVLDIYFPAYTSTNMH